MAVEVENVLQVEMLYAAVNQAVEMENRLFFHNDLGWSAGLIESVLTDVLSAWDTNIQPVTNFNTALVGARARDIGNDPYGPIFEDFLSAPLPGTLATDAVPYLASATIRFLAAPGEDVRRGYIRMPGLDESQVTGNALTSAARIAIANAWGNFFDEVTSANPGVTHVVVSMFDGFTLDPRPDGTVVKKPTPRASGLSGVVETYAVAPTVGRAVSRAGLRR